MSCVPADRETGEHGLVHRVNDAERGAGEVVHACAVEVREEGARRQPYREDPVDCAARGVGKDNLAAVVGIERRARDAVQGEVDDLGAGPIGGAGDHDIRQRRVCRRVDGHDQLLTEPRFRETPPTIRRERQQRGEGAGPRHGSVGRGSGREIDTADRVAGLANHIDLTVVGEGDPAAAGPCAGQGDGAKHGVADSIDHHCGSILRQRRDEPLTVRGQDEPRKARGAGRRDRKGRHHGVADGIDHDNRRPTRCEGAGPGGDEDPGPSRIHYGCNGSPASIGDR